MVIDRNAGKESEWNEATFKSKRLNDIQELINFFKMNPTGITDNRFNYYRLLKCIESLYGEGQSKYSESEKKSCERLMRIANKAINLMPPHIQLKNDRISGKSTSFLFNEKNYEMLMEVLYELEMKVKDYNDEHGLTTKNKGSSGKF